MAGRRVYVGSNMAVLLRNEGISSGAIEALLASGASPGFHVSRSMVNFEGAHGNTTEYSLYGQVDLEETGDDDLDECVHQPEKKRRLTAGQVLFLERTFEVENKLEPARKIQLAKDLGLQPRQVAIWFQNRRARWKTKQLEKDYAALKSSYNNLNADYENLLKEKDKLNAEVIVLTEQLLLNEKGRNNSETHKLKDLLMHEQVQKRDPDSTPEVQQSYVPFFVGKQEDIKCANAFDSDSPHHSDDEKRSRLLEPPGSSNTFEQDQSDLSHTEEDEDAWLLEPASSSNAFEQDHSDLSHAEEDVEEKMYRFPTLEDSSCNYGFPVEDQAFWFWHSF